MHSEIDWSIPRRQSRVVILLALLKMFKNMWPILLLLMARFFFNKGTSGDKNFSHLIWGLSGAVIIYFFIRINDIASFFFYRFCIVDQQLIIYSGFIIKKKTELPLSKIQAIHTRQTFLHKLTNTCKLTIDTAGSEKSEMEIEALNVNVAREFQQILTQKEPLQIEEELQEIAVTGKPQQLLKLTFKDTLKLCISENHLKTFLVVIGFLVSKMQDIRGWFDFDSFGWMQQHSSAVSSTTQSIILVFIIGMLFSILVSCIKVILRFYGFTIHLRQADLLIKWGLLETQQKHIPFKKVQLLSWRSTYLRRLMGMSMLRLHATAEDENKEEHMIQLPVTNPANLKTIASYYQPLLPSGHYPSTGIQKDFIARRILLIGLPITVAFTTGLYFAVGWYALLTAIWLFYFSISTYLYRSNFKVWVSSDSLQVEKGGVGQREYTGKF